LRFAAGFVAKVLSTPLRDILAMKMSEFDRWHKAAIQVHDATRLKFE
jgi:hypothetical protein